jgi:hypothetical protein
LGIGGLQEPTANQKKGWQSGSTSGIYRTKIELQRSVGQAKVKSGASHSLNSSINILEEVSEGIFSEMVREPRANIDHAKIKTAGEAAVVKAAETSWWEWKSGSTIFFGRWPPHYQDMVRKGLLPMFVLEPPVNSGRQPPYDDDKIKDKVKKKLDKVIMTDIKFVEAMMFMFDVPKVDDIRMVYDGSKSGLNKALWAPWFSLSTIDTMLRWVTAGSWLANNDYEDMFLNFPLHAKSQKYCGTDLTQLFPDMKAGEASVVVARWLRNAMGLRNSPYASVQGALRAKHIALGDLKDDDNPFQWDHVRENLPRAQNYNPSLPWIMKM